MHSVDQVVSLKGSSTTEYCYFRLLYWISDGAIQSGSMSGSSLPQNLVTTDLQQPQHLVMDPVDRVLYWTDGDKGTIEAFSVTTGTRQILYSNSASFPYGLTVYEVSSLNFKIQMLFSEEKSP